MLLSLEKLLTARLRKSQPSERMRYEAQVRWAKEEDRRHLGLYIFLGVLVMAEIGAFFSLMFM